MFDLPYILRNPLIRKITVKCAMLQQEALELPEASEQRKQVEKRLSQLEAYKLPRPSVTEAATTAPIVNQVGQKVGEMYSLRRRFRPTRRGRPEEYTIKVRAALEEKLANGALTWSVLAKKHGFENSSDLERAVRRLKVLLRRDGVLPLTLEDIQAAQHAREILPLAL